jgi:hypothetical protein
VLLNMREGSYSQGRNRNARYWNAAGSMNEVLGVLDAAEDLGYVDDGRRGDAAGRGVRDRGAAPDRREAVR